MKTNFKNSFYSDLKKIDNKVLKIKIFAVIKNIENAKSIIEISGLKKIESKKGYFRIRIGDYRIGLQIEKDVVIFVRFKHRKDIYKFFP